VVVSETVVERIEDASDKGAVKALDGIVFDRVLLLIAGNGEAPAVVPVGKIETMTLVVDSVFVMLPLIEEPRLVLDTIADPFVVVMMMLDALLYDVVKPPGAHVNPRLEVMLDFVVIDAVVGLIIELEIITLVLGVWPLGVTKGVELAAGGGGRLAGIQPGSLQVVDTDVGVVPMLKETD
jgi:hypothetical protein